MLNYLLLILGFVLLIRGGDWLVDGASSLAKRFGLSALFIGLTIVAFGTSAPELIVNIFASISGNNDIATGNIVGSNLCNILLILGISSLVYPLKVTHGTTWKEIPFSLLAILVVGLMANDALFEGRIFSQISRIDGLVLIGFFVIFLYYTIGISKVESTSNEDGDIKIFPVWRSVFMILLGLVFLTVGGKMIVDSSVQIALALGVSEALIGLTIVAIGTSLPELATSVIAARKHNADIAVGNIVGSNIFNIFWILGLSAVIHPINFNTVLNFDILMVILVTVALFSAMFIGKKHELERWQGASFLGIYCAYIVYLVIRG